MTYEDLKTELRTMPKEWYPALIRVIVEAAIEKQAVKAEGVVRYVNRIVGQPIDLTPARTLLVPPEAPAEQPEPQPAEALPAQTAARQKRKYTRKTPPIV